MGRGLEASRNVVLVECLREPYRGPEDGMALHGSPELAREVWAPYCSFVNH